LLLCLQPFFLSLLAGAGIAIDTSGVTSTQRELQHNFDALALAIAVSEFDHKSSAKELASFARDYLDSAKATYNSSDLRIKIAADGTVTVGGSDLYGIKFGRFVGRDIVNVAALSVAVKGAASTTTEPTEIVMVLDTTESMEANDKIISLRIAANTLISELEPGSKDIKLGVVPFANYVNVGVHNRGASWLEVPPDRTESYSYQPKIYNDDAYCRSNPRGTDPDVQDGVARNTGPNVCPARDWVDNSYTLGDPVDSTRVYQWNGCVRPRHKGGYATHPSLIDSDFDVLKVQGHDNMSCADPIIPLTHNFATVSTAINTLNVDKNTYMPAGIVWGRRVLSPDEPFSEGDAFGTVKKVMIVMTDGLNSMHRWGGQY